MDDATRRTLIERYREGPQAVLDALAGITEEEMDARPAPGEWSAREVVHHLADSEMTGAVRLRKLLAEDGPTIQAYEQNEFARRLHYDRPIEASLQAVMGARSSTAALLEQLQEGDWSREGVHTRRGRYTVEDWLRIYAAHAYEHADQIREARASHASSA